jgi:hypothetical protein
MQKTEADLAKEMIDRRFMTTEIGQEMVIGIVKETVILSETTGTDSTTTITTTLTTTGEGPARETPTTAFQNSTTVQGASMIAAVDSKSDRVVLIEEIVRVALMIESALEVSIERIVHVVAKMTEIVEVIWTEIGVGLTTGHDETVEVGGTMMAAIGGGIAEDTIRCAYTYSRFVSACFWHLLLHTCTRTYINI